MLFVPGYPRPKVWGVFCCYCTEVVFCAPGLSLFFLMYASDWSISLIQDSPELLIFSPRFPTSLLFFLLYPNCSKDFSSSSVIFPPAWSDLLLRLTINFSYFSLLRIVHLVEWVFFSVADFLWLSLDDVFWGYQSWVDSQHGVGRSFLSQSPRLFSTVFLPHMIPRRRQG